MLIARGAAEDAGVAFRIQPSPAVRRLVERTRIRVPPGVRPPAVSAVPEHYV